MECSQEEYDNTISKCLENTFTKPIIMLIVTFIHFQGICFDSRYDDSEFYNNNKLILFDGRMVGIFDCKTKIGIWNTIYNKCDRIITFKYKKCKKIKTLPNGGIAVMFDDNNKNLIKIYNSKNGCSYAKMRCKYDILCIKIISDILIYIVLRNQNQLIINKWNLETGYYEENTIQRKRFYNNFRHWDKFEGEHIFLYEQNGIIYIWNIELRSQTILYGHKKLVHTILWLPNKYLVSGSADNTIKIWNTITSQCIMTLIGHENRIHLLDLLPDGRLVSGSYDQKIKIWNLENGNCDKTLSIKSNIKLMKVIQNAGMLVVLSDEEYKPPITFWI